MIENNSNKNNNTPEGHLTKSISTILKWTQNSDRSIHTRIDPVPYLYNMLSGGLPTSEEEKKTFAMMRFANNIQSFILEHSPIYWETPLNYHSNGARLKRALKDYSFVEVAFDHYQSGLCSAEMKKCFSEEVLNLNQLRFKQHQVFVDTCLAVEDIVGKSIAYDETHAIRKKLEEKLKAA